MAAGCFWLNANIRYCTGTPLLTYAAMRMLRRRPRYTGNDTHLFAKRSRHAVVGAVRYLSSSLIVVNILVIPESSSLFRDGMVNLHHCPPYIEVAMTVPVSVCLNKAIGFWEHAYKFAS